MRRFIGFVLAAALVPGLGPQPAFARPTASHLRWEGAAVVLGTIGLVAVLNEVARAQPAAVGAGGWYPANPGPGYCPPPPPPRRPVGVPGYWDSVEIWVPGAWVSFRGGGDCRDHHDRRRGHGRHDRDDCGAGRHPARGDGGHFERRRVWREGYYR